MFHEFNFFSQLNARIFEIHKDHRPCFMLHIGEFVLDPDLAYGYGVKPKYKSLIWRKDKEL